MDVGEECFCGAPATARGLADVGIPAWAREPSSDSGSGEQRIAPKYLHRPRTQVYTHADFRIAIARACAYLCTLPIGLISRERLPKAPPTSHAHIVPKLRSTPKHAVDTNTPTRTAVMNFVTFNQDHSHLGVGTPNGYRIYTTDPFNKQSESREGDVSSLEMLFSTSLVALTLSPRVLRIQNTKRHSTICEMTFRTAILAMRMNRKRIVVVLESELYIYDISNLQMLKTEKTSPNPNAICALSASSENNYLVYPLPTKAAPATFQPPSHAPPKTDHIAPTSGEVLIYDATKMEAVNVIEAHNSPLSCIALNSDGTLLATASEKGTIIRVFSIPDAQKLYQFRRGSIPARIYSMSFNSTSTLLSVSSATETVHIFRLGAPNSRSNSVSSGPSKPMGASHARSNSRASQETEDEFGTSTADITSPERKAINPTFGSLIRRTSQTVGKSFAATVGGYLPSAVAEIWEPSRDFAWVKIPRSPTSLSSGPVRNVVALNNNGPQIMVVTSEGNYYVFNVDLEKGGEGTLYKQYSLLEPNELAASNSQDVPE